MSTTTTVPAFRPISEPDNTRNFDPAVASEKYWIDPTEELQEDDPVLTIGGQVVGTLGNYMVVAGKAKSRKTFTVGGLTAAGIIGSSSLEPIKGFVRQGKNIVLYFDTEQGRNYVLRSIKRICRQTGIDKPTNFKAMGLRSATPKQRLDIIDYQIRNTPGLALVIIDGIADLMQKGINDETEATEMTNTMMKWTEQYKIHIVCVLHHNKAAGNTDVRGHLGTVLQNKAETIIDVTKDPKNPDFSIVSPKYCKDRDFEPFSFTIDENGLPIMGDAPSKIPVSTKSVKRDELLQLILKDRERVKHTYIKAQYMELSGCKDKTACNHIAAGLIAGVIVKNDDGSYSLPFSIEYDSDATF